MNYLQEHWWPIVFGLFVVAMLVVSITTWLRHRRSLKALAAEITDERQAQVSSFSIDGSVAGHYRGRSVKLSIREGGRNQAAQLTLQLSCTAPSVFSLDRPNFFGLSPSTIAAGAAGVAGSFGFLLERSGIMPRKLFGIDMGGSTGLPLAPIGDPGFDESFCLSAFEPARDAVIAWMRTPEVKEQVYAFFSAERIALLTLTRDRSGEVFMATAVRRFREVDLEASSVRPLLDQLIRIAKSIEALKPIETLTGTW